MRLVITVRSFYKCLIRFRMLSSCAFEPLPLPFSDRPKLLASLACWTRFTGARVGLISIIHMAPNQKQSQQWLIHCLNVMCYRNMNFREFFLFFLNDVWLRSFYQWFRPFFLFYPSFLRQCLVLLKIVIMYHKNSLKGKNQIFFRGDTEYLSFFPRIFSKVCYYLVLKRMEEGQYPSNWYQGVLYP